MQPTLDDSLVGHLLGFHRGARTLTTVSIALIAVMTTAFVLQTNLFLQIDGLSVEACRMLQRLVSAETRFELQLCKHDCMVAALRPQFPTASNSFQGMCINSEHGVAGGSGLRVKEATAVAVPPSPSPRHTPRNMRSYSCRREPRDGMPKPCLNSKAIENSPCPMW